jgi:hypothetical protein
MMELHFSDKSQQQQGNYIRDTQGNTVLAQERREVESNIQRQCWDVEIMIDRRLPSDQIPEEFLRSSIDLLNGTITAINQLLEPLNTIKEVLFYGCAATIILDFVMAFQESYQCEFAGTVSKLNSDEEAKWDPYFAKTGQCDIYEGEAKEACQSCSDTVLQKKEMQSVLKNVCDRIFCPSAPTFQKYVEEKSKEAGSMTAQQAAEQKKQVVSHCAFGEDFRGEIDYES